MVALAAAGIEPQLIATSRPGEAIEMARNAVEEGADLVVALGGDGTINEALNGVVYTNVPLAALPGGTANVLSVETGMGTRPAKAAAMLELCVPERVSVGRLTSAKGERRYFLLMAGAGLDAQIVWDVHPGLKAAAGKLAYWIAGFRQMSTRLCEFDAHVNGRTYRCGFALASRVRNYGGDLEIARSASLFEDDFEVVLFEGANPFRYLKYLLGVAAGDISKMRGVRVFHAQRVELEGPARVQVDGEYAGELPVTLEIIPRAVTLLLPPDVRDRIPARVQPRQLVWTTSPTR